MAKRKPIKIKATARTKDEIYWAVLRSALELDAKKGHLRWTISELSRFSKTTRSLIYYYFGRRKDNILFEAVRLLGDELFGISSSRMNLWRSGRIAESIWASREVMREQPLLQSFYILHRSREGAIADQIRLLEKKHQQKIAHFLPELSIVERQLLATFIISLVFAPQLDRKTVDFAVERFVNPLMKNKLARPS